MSRYIRKPAIPLHMATWEAPMWVNLAKPGQIREPTEDDWLAETEAPSKNDDGSRMLVWVNNIQIHNLCLECVVLHNQEEHTVWSGPQVPEVRKNGHTGVKDERVNQGHRQSGDSHLRSFYFVCSSTGQGTRKDCTIVDQIYPHRLVWTPLFSRHFFPGQEVDKFRPQ